MTPRRRRTGLVALFIVAIAIVVGWLIANQDDGANGERPLLEGITGSPNLIVVMVDDQTFSAYDDKAMPFTRRFFARSGTTFDQAIAAPPLCCPSRAGFLTGRYAHNTGVVENTEGYRTLDEPRKTFPAALQAAGYETAMVGKFLNGYEPAGGAEPAPGFDRWYSIFGYADYFDFMVSDDGEIRNDPGYATDSLTREGIEFARSASGRDNPFFLWLSYNAPHTVLPANEEPCDGRTAQPRTPADFQPFAREPLPRPPSFDAAPGGAPSLAGTDSLSTADMAQATRAWRCARAAMVAVDEGFERLVGELRQMGELEDTVIVYLSDNGLYFGEHRLTDDKRLPLEPALHIPMAIAVGSGSGVDGFPSESDDLVSQVDLGPTLLDYAGADPCPQGSCPPIDGRSLRPLLEGDGDLGEDRAIPLKLDDGWTYEAIRTPRYLYMEIAASRKREYAEPEPELYDLDADPDQLENLAGDASAADIQEELSDRLQAAIECRGTEDARACD